MDFNTIKRRLTVKSSNRYQTVENFLSDVKLVLSNCATYNHYDSEVAQVGREVEEYFKALVAKFLPYIDLVSIPSTGHNTNTSGGSNSGEGTAVPGETIKKRKRKDKSLDRLLMDKVATADYDDDDGESWCSGTGSRPPSAASNVINNEESNEKERPSSRGNVDRPSSRASVDRPSSRGNVDRPASRGNVDRPSSRGNIDRPASRGNVDRPSSRGLNDDAATSQQNNDNTTASSNENVNTITDNNTARLASSDNNETCDNNKVQSTLDKEESLRSEENTDKIPNLILKTSGDCAEIVDKSLSDNNDIDKLITEAGDAKDISNIKENTNTNTETTTMEVDLEHETDKKDDMCSTAADSQTKSTENTENLNMNELDEKADEFLPKDSLEDILNSSDTIMGDASKLDDIAMSIEDLPHMEELPILALGDGQDDDDLANIT